MPGWLQTVWMKTDASGRYGNVQAYHLIGLELNISFCRVAARRATGQPHGFPGDVASVAKRGLHAGELLDGEAGHTVGQN